MRRERDMELMVGIVIGLILFGPLVWAGEAIGALIWVIWKVINGENPVTYEKREKEE